MADTMDSFSKILSSAAFLSGNFLRKAEELYGITNSHHDLFKAFTEKVLRRCAPSLLHDIPTDYTPRRSMQLIGVSPAFP
jgi:hypothetical protein